MIMDFLTTCYDAPKASAMTPAAALRRDGIRR
jgi:hypothetical protein